MYRSQQKTGKDSSLKESRCTAYKAYYQLSATSKVLVFFRKQHLPPDVIQQFFSHGQFEMPFSYELPTSLLHKLGLESYKIHPGTYPIFESYDFIRVEF